MNNSHHHHEREPSSHHRGHEYASAKLPFEKKNQLNDSSHQRMESNYESSYRRKFSRIPMSFLEMKQQSHLLKNQSLSDSKTELKYHTFLQGSYFTQEQMLPHSEEDDLTPYNYNQPQLVSQNKINGVLKNIIHKNDVESDVMSPISNNNIDKESSNINESNKNTIHSLQISKLEKNEESVQSVDSQRVLSELEKIDVPISHPQESIQSYTLKKMNGPDEDLEDTSLHNILEYKILPSTHLLESKKLEDNKKNIDDIDEYDNIWMKIPADDDVILNNNQLSESNILKNDQSLRIDSNILKNDQLLTESTTLHHNQIFHTIIPKNIDFDLPVPINSHILSSDGRDIIPISSGGYDTPDSNILVSHERDSISISSERNDTQNNNKRDDILEQNIEINSHNNSTISHIDDVYDIDTDNSYIKHEIIKDNSKIITLSLNRSLSINDSINEIVKDNNSSILLQSINPTQSTIHTNSKKDDRHAHVQSIVSLPSVHMQSNIKDDRLGEQAIVPLPFVRMVQKISKPIPSIRSIFMKQGTRSQNSHKAPYFMNGTVIENRKNRTSTLPWPGDKKIEKEQLSPTAAKQGPNQHPNRVSNTLFPTKSALTVVTPVNDRWTYTNETNLPLFKKVVHQSNVQVNGVPPSQLGYQGNQKVAESNVNSQSTSMTEASETKYIRDNNHEQQKYYAIIVLAVITILILLYIVYEQFKGCYLNHQKEISRNRCDELQKSINSIRSSTALSVSGAQAKQDLLRNLQKEYNKEKEIEVLLESPKRTGCWGSDSHMEETKVSVPEEKPAGKEERPSIRLKAKERLDIRVSQDSILDKEEFESVLRSSLKLQNKKRRSDTNNKRERMKAMMRHSGIAFSNRSQSVVVDDKKRRMTLPQRSRSMYSHEPVQTQSSVEREAQEWKMLGELQHSSLPTTDEGPDTFNLPLSSRDTSDFGPTSARKPNSTVNNQNQRDQYDVNLKYDEEYY